MEAKTGHGSTATRSSRSENQLEKPFRLGEFL